MTRRGNITSQVIRRQIFNGKAVAIMTIIFCHSGAGRSGAIKCDTGIVRGSTSNRTKCNLGWLATLCVAVLSPTPACAGVTTCFPPSLSRQSDSEGGRHDGDFITVKKLNCTLNRVYSSVIS